MNELLHNELEHVLKEMAETDPCSEEYEQAVKNMKILHDAIVDEDRLANEHYRIECESTLKDEEIRASADETLAKLAESKKDRRKDICETVIKVGFGALICVMCIYSEETRIIAMKPLQFLRLIKV